MSISTEQISSTAKLAKLRVDNSEMEELTSRISSILDLVDQMQAVNTDNVQPMANALDAEQKLRADDIVEPENKIASRDAFLAIAPASEDGLFLVPKVID